MLRELHTYRRLILAIGVILGGLLWLLHSRRHCTTLSCLPASLPRRRRTAKGMGSALVCKLSLKLR